MTLLELSNVKQATKTEHKALKVNAANYVKSWTKEFLRNPSASNFAQLNETNLIYQNIVKNIEIIIG